MQTSDKQLEEIRAELEQLRTHHASAMGELTVLKDGNAAIDLEANMQLMTTRALEAEALAIEVSFFSSKLHGSIK